MTLSSDYGAQAEEDFSPRPDTPGSIDLDSRHQWDINDNEMPLVSEQEEYEDWPEGHCRYVYKGDDEDAKRHSSGWAMRNTNNHNINILKKSCIGVLVCNRDCVMENGGKIHMRPAICDKARRKQIGKQCPNARCNGRLDILPCRGHCGYPVTHFWRHTKGSVFFQAKGVHDHPRPEIKSSAEARRLVYMNKDGSRPLRATERRGRKRASPDSVQELPTKVARTEGRPNPVCSCPPFECICGPVLPPYREMSPPHPPPPMYQPPQQMQENWQQRMFDGYSTISSDMHQPSSPSFVPRYSESPPMINSPQPSLNVEPHLHEFFTAPTQMPVMDVYQQHNHHNPSQLYYPESQPYAQALPPYPQSTASSTYDSDCSVSTSFDGTPDFSHPSDFLTLDRPFKSSSGCDYGVPSNVSTSPSYQSKRPSDLASLLLPSITSFLGEEGALVPPSHQNEHVNRIMNLELHYNEYQQEMLRNISPYGDQKVPSGGVSPGYGPSSPPSFVELQPLKTPTLTKKDFPSPLVMDGNAFMPLTDSPLPKDLFASPSLFTFSPAIDCHQEFFQFPVNTNTSAR